MMPSSDAAARARLTTITKLRNFYHTARAPQIVLPRKGLNCAGQICANQQSGVSFSVDGRLRLVRP
jgi:hypothetical protein